MLSRKISLIVSVLILFTAAISSNVKADNDTLTRSGQGMSQSLFDPAVDTKGHITMDGSPVLPHRSFSLGLMIDFGFKGLPAVEQADVENAQGHNYYRHITIDKMITARFQANFGLWDRVAIGFQIPIVLPSGEFYELDPEGLQTRSHWSNVGSFGDIDLHIKAHLLRSDWHPVGIAFIAQYLIPSGKSEILTGEPGGGAFAFKAVIDAELGLRYRIGLNGGVRVPLGNEDYSYLSWNESNIAMFRYGPTVYFGLGQSINLWPGLMDLVIEGYGNQLLSEAGNTKYLSLEANAAFKFYIEENSYLMAGYGHGIPLSDTGSGYGVQSVEHRMFLGFAFEPSMDLRIRDKELDRDGDGIFDQNDQCPDDPEDLNGIEDEDGCPENDLDGDGIKDDVDKCPLVPEDMDGDRDSDGCPEQDKEYVGAVTVGSNAESDRDMDRILDINDACPDDPETYNGRDDEDGCPDEGDVVITNSSLMIMKKVYFEYNSDKIKPISFNILDEVALTINNNPQLSKLQIQGHADSRGNAKYNLKLTQRRSKAVYKYLIKKGVEKDKLGHKGFGEYCPINPAETDAAYDENRRVDFKVVELNGNPTGVVLGCSEAESHGIR